jgi:hypothetical protein
MLNIRGLRNLSLRLGQQLLPVVPATWAFRSGNLGIPQRHVECILFAWLEKHAGNARKFTPVLRFHMVFSR